MPSDVEGRGYGAGNTGPAAPASGPSNPNEPSSPNTLTPPNSTSTKYDWGSPGEARGLGISWKDAVDDSRKPTDSATGKASDAKKYNSNGHYKGTIENDPRPSDVNTYAPPAKPVAKGGYEPPKNVGGASATNTKSEVPKAAIPNPLQQSSDKELPAVDIKDSKNKKFENEVVAGLTGRRGPWGCIIAIQASIRTDSGPANDAFVVQRILSKLNPGTNKGVYLVDSEPALESLFRKLTRGGRSVPDSNYPGPFFELPDGTTIGIRRFSESEKLGTAKGPTIDVIIAGERPQRVHVCP
jgi:hypothetical protein